VQAGRLVTHDCMWLLEARLPDAVLVHVFCSMASTIIRMTSSNRIVHASPYCNSVCESHLGKKRSMST
jgi:hypothetical protein